MNLRKAAEMALEALEEINKLSVGEKAICLPAEIDGAMEALRQALAQPVDLAKVGEVGVWGNGDAVNMSQERVDETAKGEHEPVAWLWKNQDGHQVLTDDPDYADGTWTPLYTAPPKREWVGLSDEEKYDVLEGATGDGGRVYYDTLFRSYEAKLKEKNT